MRTPTVSIQPQDDLRTMEARERKWLTWAVHSSCYAHAWCIQHNENVLYFNYCKLLLYKLGSSRLVLVPPSYITADNVTVEREWLPSAQLLAFLLTTVTYSNSKVKQLFKITHRIFKLYGRYSHKNSTSRRLIHWSTSIQRPVCCTHARDRTENTWKRALCV